jgi:N-acetylglutamate synthase-like GNAT family acetyltransferase
MIPIGQAQAGDFPAVPALLEEHGLPQDGLEAHLGTMLVARQHGQVVGSAALERYGSAALLRSVAVAAARRGQGIGKQLTEAAMALARRLGVAEVYLLTETAGDFLPRFGFRPITRAQVAPAVQQSAEFRGACPQSAQVMVAAINAA